MGPLPTSERFSLGSQPPRASGTKGRGSQTSPWVFCCSFFFLKLQKLLVCFKIKAGMGTLGSLIVWRGERGCISISLLKAVWDWDWRLYNLLLPASELELLHPSFASQRTLGGKNTSPCNGRSCAKASVKQGGVLGPCWHQLRKHWCRGEEQW